MSYVPVPELETKRLFLRGVRLEDAPSYERHFNDYEVIRYLSNEVPWPYPKGGVEIFLNNVLLPELGRGRWFWCVFLKENKSEVIGGIGLWREGRPEHRAFWLSREHWGKGYMTEAIRPVNDWAFDVLGFETLIFANAVGNIRSRRIKEKTGARLIATEPAKFVDPQLTEHEIWELTKSNWKQQYKPN